MKLEHALPVLIVYWTVSVGASGDIHYTRDVYGLDAPVLSALDGPSAAIAEDRLAPRKTGQ